MATGDDKDAAAAAKRAEQQAAVATAAADEAQGFAKSAQSAEAGAQQSAAAAQGAEAGARQTVNDALNALAGGSAPSAHGYGDELAFATLDTVGPLDRSDIRSFGAIHFEGVLWRLGVYRAGNQLVTRFLAGNLDVEPGNLRDKICDYVLAEPLRIDEDVRDAVLVDPARDAEYARLVERLTESVTLWDLARRDHFAGVTPSEPTARRRLVRNVEEIAIFADEEGGGGPGLVSEQAGRELIELLVILNHPDLIGHVQGQDLFERLHTLLPDEPLLATNTEAHLLADLAEAGRELAYAVADHVADLDGITTGDLDTIGALAYDFSTAHRGLNPPAGGAAAIDVDAAVETGNLLLRLR